MDVPERLDEHDNDHKPLEETELGVLEVPHAQRMVPVAVRYYSL